MAQRYVSLDEKNQFSFKCPVFNAETRMGACVKLRDMVWRGQTPEVRKGCQAAMQSNLCPAASMVSLYIFDKKWDNDFHGSKEPKKGRLHAAVLERISRSMANEEEIKRLHVPENEAEALRDARFRIQKELETAPGEAPQRASDYEPPRKRRSTKSKQTPEHQSKVVDAAKTGDLTAAINA